jgi:hypothetical protein
MGSTHPPPLAIGPVLARDFMPAQGRNAPTLGQARDYIDVDAAKSRTVGTPNNP